MKSRTQQLRHNASFTPIALGLLAMSILSSSAAMAAEEGWYLGTNYGQTRSDTVSPRIVNALIGGGYTTKSLHDDEKDRGYKLFGGYQFNDSFAVEGGYFNLGKFRYQAEMDRMAVVRGDSKTDGFNLDFVGSLPMGEQFSIFAKVGAVYAENRDRRWDTGPFINQYNHDKSHDTTYKYGVGVEYAITQALGMRLEGESYRIDDLGSSKSHIDMLSVGLVYRFGAKKTVAAVPASTAPVVAAAARPAAPAPTPAPTPAPAPVRITLSADSLFSFDSTAVQPAGKAELDTLAAGLRGVEFDRIQVTGHTDRIGSQEYNLRLSNQRATAVKDYLVNSANIPAAKVTTRGVNGAEPVTTAAQCGGQLNRAQLIACLAPDRRVEVEVIGTRPR